MVPAKRRKSKRARNEKIALIGAAVIIIVLIVYALDSKVPGYPARTPASLPDVPISTSAVYHIHVHLDVFVNGSHVTVPDNLGHLPDGSLYAIHTHDTTGIIHLEAAVQQAFTLGQIFEVWGWPLDGNHIFDQTGPVTLYINSSNNPHLFDANYALTAHDEIALVYGGAPSTGIPSSYNFPAGS